jgi:protein-tyrosine phosphatase
VEKAKSELKIEFLELNWEDTESWIITDESLRECVLFIDTGLKSGGSVLVHCAQGKSRSSTAVVAYVMVKELMTLSESMSLVKDKHKMAEPNPHFMNRLAQFEKSQLLQDLRIQINS